ncbi:MAG: PAC2 family protein [Chloroflexota bacterium]
MSDAINIWDKPDDDELYMIAGWRQWADAGSMSSMLPRYLLQETDAKKIGEISGDGFYLFQIPATHDLVRPVVQFEDGFPEALEERKNELYYAKIGDKGVVYFLGDEPHLDVERYVKLFLEAAEQLNVKRIISFGGVYAEVPYDKERPVSCSYSKRSLKAELDELSVELTSYHGGAAIGSYICKKAADADMEYVGFYAFAPTYDFSHLMQGANGFQIENDFRAWLGVMRRVKHMLQLNIDLADLEDKTAKLNMSLDEKITEMDEQYPQLNIRKFFKDLADDYDEVVFEPISTVWEDELRRLLDDEE